MSRARPINVVLATTVLMLPWLNPIASGPTPSVIPWLVSTACAASLCLLAAHTEVRREVVIGNGWLLAALVSSALGLLQYFDASAFLNGWVNTPPSGVVYGNLRQRNQFATLVNIGLIALVCLALHRQKLRATGALRGNGHVDVVWMTGAAALLAIGNAASLSRTGVMQLAAILTIALMWSWWKNTAVRRMLVLVVVVYLLAALVLPWLAGRDPFAAGIVSRFGDDAQRCQSRLLLWRNVLHLIALKPWFGWGWGELDFAHFITIYPGPRFCDILDNAHNLPLHLAVVLGLPVALLVCGLVVWLVLRARPWRERDPGRQLAWAVLALIGLHSLLEYPLWYGPFQIAVVLALWLLWRTPAQAAGAERSVVRPYARIPASITGWVGACAIAVLLAVAYAAWEYHRIGQIYRSPEQRAPAYRDNTLAKVQDSWLFRNQVRFAALTLTTVTPSNAASINRSAHALLHFSPEARVVEKLIDSALVLGRTDEAVFYMRRFRIAFPKDYARWRETHAATTALPSIDP